MITVSKDQLAAITDAIKHITNPKLVILFGSQARGTADQHSDIDLLVIGDRPLNEVWSRRREIGKIRRSLPPTKIPVDILFFTPDEVLKWRDTTNHIISEAFQEGEVLYERS
ncbi:MAG TPA: nucleotidyltransferase domain-containing protein [Pyrinomonadaceae bacterium]|nr:nucleotidyltransferase domain-containing protein [Pyrinomonadaceae bacterium]